MLRFEFEKDTELNIMLRSICYVFERAKVAKKQYYLLRCLFFSNLVFIQFNIHLSRFIFTAKFHTTHVHWHSKHSIAKQWQKWLIYVLNDDFLLFWAIKHVTVNNKWIVNEYYPG